MLDEASGRSTGSMALFFFTGCFCRYRLVAAGSRMLWDVLDPVFVEL